MEVTRCGKAIHSQRPVAAAVCSLVLLAGCITTKTSTVAAGPYGGAQQRYSVAVESCQQTHASMVSDAARESQPMSGPDRTLTACMAEAQGEMGMGQAER